jgi:hypothetical protein
MNTFSRYVAAGAALVCLVTASFFLISCDGDSAETAIRDIVLRISGVYRHPDAGSTLVSQNTGNPITQLDLRQTGDQLEAIDNNGGIFKGTIGQESDTQGSFTLDGQTSVGQPATIAGTINKSGDNLAEMRGTWIEPSLFGTVFGVAIVPSNAPSGGGGTTNGTTTNLSISVQSGSTTLTNNGDTVTLLASGGDSGSGVTWSETAGSGSFNSTTANPVTYTRTAAGNNTITVSDGTDTESIGTSQP